MVLALQFSDQRPHKADVIHLIIERRAATTPGIPGQESIGPSAGPVWISYDKPLFVRFRTHAGRARRVCGISATAMEDHHQRQRSLVVVSRRQVNDIAS